MQVSNLHKRIMSLLLVNDKLAAEDISMETKIDVAIITQQLVQLCRQEHVTIDRSHPRALYSINEAHLAEIIDFVRRYSQEE